jgi:hypothetical protein
MSQIYIESRKWSSKDLADKTVAFRITYPKVTAEGIGIFRVHGNGTDLMAIDIVVPHPEDCYDNIYHLVESLVARIEPHPDPSVAHFRCAGAFSA